MQPTTTAFDIDAYQQWRASCFYPKADLPLSNAVVRGEQHADLDDASMARACAFALREPVMAVPLHERGTFHWLWRIEGNRGATLICRANAMHRWYRDYPLAIDEYVGDLCAENDVPVVHVKAIDLSRRHIATDFAILEEARGASLRSFDADEARLGPYLRELGRVLGRLHRIEIDDGFGLLDMHALANDSSILRGCHSTWDDYLATRLDDHVASCVSFGVILAAEGERIRRLFEDCRGIYAHGRPVLLHGDPGSHNVFAANGKITAVLDWEDALAGDPIYDIAFWATFHPERRHEMLLAGYRHEAELPADFESRFWLYFLRISLAKTVLRQRLGLRDAPGREPASRRVRLGLQRLEAVLV